MSGRVCDKSPSHGYAPDGICKWCEEPELSEAEKDRRVEAHQSAIGPVPEPPTFLDVARVLARDGDLCALTRPNPLLVDKPYAGPAPIGFKVSDWLSRIDPRDPTHARTLGGLNAYDPRCLVCQLLGRAYFKAAGDEQAAP